jgi:Fe-S-cluster containining protein
MMDKKCLYECGRCANCCKLAVSEYSYEQLKQRAMRGDKFSRDFVSVFVPYESEEEAKKVNPEYFELLNELVDDRVYYYYCPKLDGNTCTIYEDRPDICKDFPHNPLKLLPSSCSFNEWKNEISKSAMLLKAKTDIIEFYKNKLG